MNRCRYHDWILSLIDGDLDKSRERELTAHFEQCHDCKKAWVDTLAAHRKLCEISIPEPSQSVISDFKYELNHNLNRFQKKKNRLLDVWLQIKNSTQWLWRGAYATVLVLIGILIGRFWILPHTVLEADRAVIQKSYNPLLNDYLIDSEILLLTLDNSSNQIPERSLNYDQHLAHSVLEKSRRLQPVLNENTDGHFIRFINQLEIICMELTNRDSQEIRATFKDLKAMIRETGLIEETRRLQQKLDDTKLPNI